MNLLRGTLLWTFPLCLGLAGGCGDDGGAAETITGSGGTGASLSTTADPSEGGTSTLGSTSTGGMMSSGSGLSDSDTATTAGETEDPTTGAPTTGDPTTGDPTTGDPTDDGNFWSRKLSTDLAETVTAMAATDDGFILSGDSTQEIDLGGGVVAEGGAFFARFGLDGSPAWARTVWGTRVADVAVGPTGEIVVLMHMFSSIELGGMTFDAPGEGDILLAKYSPDGTFMWGRGFGAPGYQYPRALTVNAAGEIIMVGSFEEPVDFGGGPLEGGFNHGFIAHLDGDGDHIWSHATNGGSVDDVAATGQDFVVVGAYAGAAVDFGDGPVVDGQNGFLVRYGADHAVQWKRIYDSDTGNRDTVNRVAVGGDSVYVAGVLDKGVVDLGGGVLESTEDNSVFLVKLAATGTYLWSHQFGTPGCGGGAGDCKPTDLVYSPGEGVIVIGHFSVAIDLGGGLLESSPFDSAHIFAANFDENGVYGWSRHIGATPPTGIYSEYLVVGATDAAGGWFFGSAFVDDIDLGYGIHTADFGGDLVLARLPTSG